MLNKSKNVYVILPSTPNVVDSWTMYLNTASKKDGYMTKMGLCKVDVIRGKKLFPIGDGLVWYSPKEVSVWINKPDSAVNVLNTCVPLKGVQAKICVRPYDGTRLAGVPLTFKRCIFRDGRATTEEDFVHMNFDYRTKE